MATNAENGLEILNKLVGTEEPAGEWFEIKHEIDLTDEMGDEGWQKVYIDGDLWFEKIWNCGVGACGPERALGSLDLFANEQPDVYYDDISLVAGQGGGEPKGCLYKLKKKVKAKGGCKVD